MPDPASYAVVVLAGGAGRRLAGADKPATLVGGRTSLDRLLAALPAAVPVVVVGPRRPVPRPVTWCTEDPPLSGPAAAIAAALPHLTAPVAVVLGGDMPFAGPLAPALARAVGRSMDGAITLSREGRQHLASAVRRTALAARVAELAAHGGVADQSVARLYHDLTMAVVADPQDDSVDFDTPAELAALNARTGATR